MEERHCVICGTELEGPNPYVLYHSEKNGLESFACAECERLLKVLMSEEDASKLRHALEYFAQYAHQIREIADKDLLAVLSEIIEDAVRLSHADTDAAE